MPDSDELAAQQLGSNGYLRGGRQLAAEVAQRRERPFEQDGPLDDLHEDVIALGRGDPPPVVVETLFTLGCPRRRHLGGLMRIDPVA